MAAESSETEATKHTRNHALSWATTSLMCTPVKHGRSLCSQAHSTA